MSEAISPPKLGGKYLTFNLVEEDYGIDILQVVEIIGITNITPLPQVSNHVKGVINLRGKVILVIDLRLKFNLEEAEYTSETCIVVLSHLDFLMGIIIDRVKYVIDIESQEIEPPPPLRSETQAGYIIGLGKVEGKINILLDIKKILDEDLSPELF